MVKNTILFFEKISILFLGEVHMRKYIFLSGFIMICLLVMNIKPSYGLEVINETETNIRSNEFLTYVSENNINNIKRLCVKEFCDTLRGSSLEKSFAIFSEKYKNYLKETKGEEIALETSLKGFIITKIETLS